MFELADVLSHFVGGPTILEDANFGMVGYSAYSGESDPGRKAAILLRRIPPEWLTYLRSEGVLDRLRHTEDVIPIEHGPLGAKRRLITSVRAKGDLIGVIWVAEGDSPLDDSSIERLQQVRPMAALYFQRNLAAEWAGRSHRSAFLRHLVEGTGDAGRGARDLGLQPSADYCLVAAFPDVAGNAGAGVAADHELFARHLGWYDSTTPSTILGGALYGLAPVRRPTDRDRLKVIASRMTADTSGRGLGVVVLSTPRPVTGYLTVARQEIRALLALIWHRADAPPVIAGWEYEAAVMAKRAERLLKADQRFEFGKLAAVEAYDAKHRGILADTLAVYLSVGASVSRAAQVLQVHHTTLRYRLRRIIEISGLRLDDPAERLAAQLHLLAAGRWPAGSDDGNTSPVLRLP
jgi:hypothetical protein